MHLFMNNTKSLCVPDYGLFGCEFCLVCADKLWFLVKARLIVEELVHMTASTNDQVFHLLHTAKCAH